MVVEKAAGLRLPTRLKCQLSRALQAISNHHVADLKGQLFSTPARAGMTWHINLVEGI